MHLLIWTACSFEHVLFRVVDELTSDEVEAAKARIEGPMQSVLQQDLASGGADAGWAVLQIIIAVCLIILALVLARDGVTTLVKERKQ